MKTRRRRTLSTTRPGKGCCLASKLSWYSKESIISVSLSWATWSGLDMEFLTHVTMGVTIYVSKIFSVRAKITILRTKALPL